MNFDIKVRKENVNRTCPNCGRQKILEWCAGKTDNSMQEYLCRNCRTYTRIYGLSAQDQDTIDSEAWM